MASETDLDKDLFVEFHGELAWTRLVKPRLENKEFVAYLASVNPSTSVEGWVHRFVVSPMLFLMGYTGSGNGMYEASLIDLKKRQQPPQRVLYVNDDGDYTLYDATGADALTEAALYILKERSEAYRWKHSKKDLEDPALPTMSKEDISKLKEGPVKTAALQEWETYEWELKLRKTRRRDNANLEKALGEKNGKLALQILEEHNEQGSSRDSVKLVHIRPAKGK